MVKIKWVLIALLIITMAGLPGLVGCGGGGGGGGGGGNVTENYTAFIGGGFPLAGSPYPEDGQAVLDAFQNYAEWVNANHKISPWSTDTFPSNIVLEVTWTNDKADPPTAITAYNDLVNKGTGTGLKMWRIDGSGVATAIMNTLITDQVAATTQACGPYLVTPRVGTIFTTYPIYTDQMAAVADWFMTSWNTTHPAGPDYVKPKVGYLTNASFGMTVPTAEMTAYLQKIGYTVDTTVQVVPVVPATPADTAVALSYCKDNGWNLAIGAMLVAGAVPTMKEADTLSIGGFGTTYTYNMTIAQCSPAHLTIYLRDSGAPATVVGNGLVIAGSYPPWTDTGEGVAFCKTLMNSYMAGGFKDTEHIMYQQGVAEAMIQVDALRLAMLNTGKNPDQLTSADIYNYGFLKIKDLDTKGIIPTTITYGPGDVEGAESVRLDQNQNGVDVLLGTWPLRHVY
jgi:hypothetical protein